jgi:methionyl aminopeptidase
VAQGQPTLKTRREIDIMREAGRIVAETLALVSKEVRPGLTTADLDKIGHDYIRSRGAVPSFKGYNGFPASLCTSVNEEIVHGIPGPRVLQEGDLLSIDCGAFYRGYHGDAATTVGVGKIEPAAQKMIDVGWESLWAGIKLARAGNRLEDISATIQEVLERNGYGVVRDLVGHGIGRRLHEAPNVPNFGRRGQGLRLVPGMVLAIEPMLTQGSYEGRTLEDDWTIVTVDQGLAVHVEHTVAITDGDPEILTLP